VPQRESDDDQAVMVATKPPPLPPLASLVDDDVPAAPRSRRAKEEVDDDVPRTVKKRKKRRKSKSLSAGAVYGIAAALGLACLLMIGLAFVSPVVAALAMILGLFITVVAWFWFVGVAFSESAVEGLLCLLAPFYSLFFLLNHLDRALRPFLVYLLGCFILMMSLCAGGIMSDLKDDLLIDRGDPVFVGADCIFIMNGATRAQALSLGEKLRELKIFNGPNGQEAQLSKRGVVFVISIPCAPADWRDPEVAQLCHTLRAQTSETIFQRAPVEVRLCDGDYTMRTLIH
jgi:hypothetical protein